MEQEVDVKAKAAEAKSFWTSGSLFELSSPDLHDLVRLGVNKENIMHSFENITIFVWTMDF